MLTLLRKYQKGIFVVVTVMVIASFAFFGTFSTFSQEANVPDKVIGKALDGSPMKKSEIDNIVRFIASDRSDRDIVYSRTYPNFLNDGVLRVDFLMSGLGQMLAGQYFDLIRSDLDTRLKRMQNFRPYTHPHAPFISAENVWKQFMPALSERLEKLKDSDLVVNEELFDLFKDLYADQAKFPTHMLRQFLNYQERQLSWVPHDTELDGGDLTLFQNHSFTDWFGFHFVEIAAQFIHNAALYAKEQGYEVSYAQARADLMKKGLEMLQVQERRQDIKPAELSEFMQKQLAVLHLKEPEAVEVWQKIMLMRTFLSDVSASTFLDATLYEDFALFAKESLEVDHYALAPAFHLKDNSEMFQFESYLDKVGKKRQGLQMPKQMYTAQELAEKGSDLVEYVLTVSMKSVTLSDIACDVGVRQTWDYQSAHWDEIKKVFPEAAVHSADSSDIPEGLREKIDAYARAQIVKESPGLVEDYLQKALSSEHVLHLPTKGLPGITDAEALLEDLRERGQLSCYTQDQEHFYNLILEDKEIAPRLLSFDEARDLLDDKERPELIARIQREVDACKTPDEAAQYRFYPYVEAARKDILLKGETSSFLGDLPWHIQKQSVSLERCALSPWIKAEAFDREEKSWSAIDVQSSGLVSFYQIQTKSALSETSEADLVEGQKLISAEVKEALFKQILDRIDQTQAISVEHGTGTD